MLVAAEADEHTEGGGRDRGLLRVARTRGRRRDQVGLVAAVNRIDILADDALNHRQAEHAGLAATARQPWRRCQDRSRRDRVPLDCRVVADCPRAGAESPPTATAARAVAVSRVIRRGRFIFGLPVVDSWRSSTKCASGSLRRNRSQPLPAAPLTTTGMAKKKRSQRRKPKQQRRKGATTLLRSQPLSRTLSCAKRKPLLRLLVKELRVNARSEILPTY
jgi:hypothetical protein